MTITEALGRIHTTFPVSSGKPVKYNNPFPLDSTTVTNLTLLGNAAAWVHLYSLKLTSFDYFMSSFQMLRWEAILLVLISLLWIHSCDGERHQAAKKGDKPRSNDAIPGSSALSSEVQGTPGIVVLYSKQSTKADFVTDKHGNIVEHKLLNLVSQTPKCNVWLRTVLKVFWGNVENTPNCQMVQKHQKFVSINFIQCIPLCYRTFNNKSLGSIPSTTMFIRNSG